MAAPNQLFFHGFIVFALSACAGTPHPATQAPVVEARNNQSIAAAPVNAPAPRLTALAPTPGPAYTPANRNDDLLFQAIAAAGVDYRNGGRNHQTGFDCSGLVAFVFREAYGLALPHNSRAQSAFGDAVDTASLQAGDLVFFNTQREPYSHVGIYLGEGKFIHAPRTGSQVRTESMNARYWATRFNGARRIVPAIIAADYSAPRKKPAVVYP